MAYFDSGDRWRVIDFQRERLIWWYFILTWSLGVEWLGLADVWPWLLIVVLVWSEWHLEISSLIRAYRTSDEFWRISSRDDFNDTYSIPLP